MSTEIKLWFQDLLEDAARSIAAEQARKADPKATVSVACSYRGGYETPTEDTPYWIFRVDSDVDLYAPNIRVTVGAALRRVMAQE